MVDQFTYHVSDDGIVTHLPSRGKMPMVSERLSNKARVQYALKNNYTIKEYNGSFGVWTMLKH